MSEARATVVIPARNERRTILECLRSVQQQSETALQILVVDGDSDDGTPDLVEDLSRQDSRIALLRNPDRTVPYALNAAMKEAQTPWLIRVDAHSVIPDDYVACALRLLESGRWGGVGGVKLAVGHTPAGKAVAAAMSSRFGVGGSVYHYGQEAQEVDHVPIGAYPLAVAREVGGWDERFTVNQDFEFDHRVRLAGHRLLFDPQLVIHWECRQTIRSLFAQYRRYGRGKVKVMLAHPDSVKPRHMGPPFLVLAAALAVVSPRGGVVRRICSGVLLPYAALMGSASIYTAGTQVESGSRRFVPGAFLAMHVGWGVGFWEGLASALRGHDR
jgi:glycosyltransferase involved in cell wall biosynthesis